MNAFNSKFYRINDSYIFCTKNRHIDSQIQVQDLSSLSAFDKYLQQRNSFVFCNKYISSFHLHILDKAENSIFEYFSFDNVVSITKI